MADQVVVTTKPWWTSKTIWLNVIATVTEILTMFNNMPGGENLKMYIPLVAGVLNIVLRTITGSPITGSPADRKGFSA